MTHQAPPGPWPGPGEMAEPCGHRRSVRLPGGPLVVAGVSGSPGRCTRCVTRPIWPAGTVPPWSRCSRGCPPAATWPNTNTPTPSCAGRRTALTRLVCCPVARHCLAHAHCPLLAVPPPDLAQHAGHGLRGWAFRHRGLDPGQASLPSQTP
jgi:hypothetical protein